MANRYYSPRDTWMGRTHISPDNFGKAERIVGFWSWGDGGSPDYPVAKLGKAYLDGLAAVDELRAKRAAVEATQRYTPFGVSEQVGAHALTNSLPKLRRARAVVERVKKELAERAAKLTLPAPILPTNRNGPRCAHCCAVSRPSRGKNTFWKTAPILWCAKQSFTPRRSCQRWECDA